MPAPACPLCGATMTDPVPDKLDQSSSTFVPAETWTCTSGKGRCASGETKYTRPLNAPRQWRNP